MSPQLVHDYDRAWRFPRVSGDEPLAKLLVETLDAFSPRERG